MWRNSDDALALLLFGGRGEATALDRVRKKTNQRVRAGSDSGSCCVTGFVISTALEGKASGHAGHFSERLRGN